MSDITENRIKVNKFLNNLYKYIKHYFRYVDREMFFSESESKSLETRLGLNIPVYKILTMCYKYTRETQYTLYTKEMMPDNKIYYSQSSSIDILAGLYFPNHDIGDKIDIYIEDDSMFPPIKISTIIVDDKNRIYLPIDDEYFINICQLVYQYITIHTNKPFYIVSMILNCKIRNSVREYRNVSYFLKRQKKYVYIDNNTVLHLIDYPSINLYQEDEIDSAIIIQRAWKRYKERKIYTKWSNHIEEVNTEIRLLPDIGIEYFNALNEFIFYSKTI
jgi:hypothetical protein